MRHSKQVLRELWELSGAIHRFRIDQIRWKDFGVSVLAGVEIQHEVGESTLQSRTEVPIDCKAGPGELHGPLQVEHSKVFAKFPVRLGFEVKLRRSAPAPRLDILLDAPDGHAGMRKVRKGGKYFSEARLGLGRLFFGDLNLLTQFLGFLDQRCGILSALL